MRGQSVVSGGPYVPQPDVYDPEAERLDRAIAGIWLLWRWSRWELLDDLGFTRAEIEEPFARFDMQYVTSERGKLSRADQVTKFLQHLREYDPALVLRVLGAAMWMVGRYLRVMREQRTAYWAARTTNETGAIEFNGQPDYLPQRPNRRQRGRGTGSQALRGGRGSGRADLGIA